MRSVDLLTVLQTKDALNVSGGLLEVGTCKAKTLYLL